MKRRTLLTAGLALLAAGCTQPQPAATPTPSATTPSAPQRPTTIGLSYIPNIQFAPFYVAQDRGLFGEVPAPVTLRHHGASEGLFNALASGAENFVIAGGSEALQARAGGTDIIAIAAYYKAFPVKVLVRGDSRINKLSDLKGRKLGVPGRYGESWFGAQVALDTAGLTESDVDIAEIGYTQLAALTTGKVDAVMGFTTNEFIQLQAAGKSPRAIDVAPGVVPLVSTCLLTTRAYAQAYPDLTRAVASAMVKGIEAVAADPSGAVTISAKHIPGLDGAALKNAATVLGATISLMDVKGGTFDPTLDPAQWSAMSAFMAEHKLTKSGMAAAEAFTNDYLG